MKNSAIRAAVVAAAYISTNAQAVEYVVPVYLSASGGTILTDRFVYEFKEAIRLSSTLSIADSKEDVFQVASLTAIDIRQEGIAYSFARSWMVDTTEVFVTHYVGTCGLDQFQKCARDLLSILATGVDTDRASVLKYNKEKAAQKPQPGKKSF